jgi:shikimate kinase
MTHQRIVLIGFMGSGKTTVGNLLAVRLGYAMVDTDILVEERAGMSVAEIFRLEGESAFRRREAEILDSLERRSAVVVATGGGAPAQPRNRAFFTRCPATFHLRVTLATAHSRTRGGAARPLLAQEENVVRRLYEERLPLYEELGIPVETEEMTPPEVVDRIMLLLEDPTLMRRSEGTS